MGKYWGKSCQPVPVEQPVFVEVVDPSCAAAETDRRFLAQAANYQHGRRLEDAERHRRILHGAKKRVRAEGKAEGFAEGKAEGIQQAMKELEIWDKGFEEGRASAGTTSKSGRSEQPRIEAPAQWAPPPRSGITPREASIPGSRAFTERRSIALSAISRADGHDAPRSLLAPSSRPARHPG